MGQAGIEQSYDRYLKGTDGTDELTVDSLGRPTSEPQPVTQPVPGNSIRLTINIKPAAGGRTSAPPGDPVDPRERRAVCGRRGDRRHGPAHRRDSRHGLEPDLPAVGLRQPRPGEARAAREREGRRPGQLPGPQPRDRRLLSAGIDLEAGHRARSDGGGDPDARASRSSARRRSRSSSRSSRTGIPTSTSRWISPRRSPSRATPTSTRWVRASTR